MGGLLYKDFVAVKGKKLILIFVIATIVFTVLRMLFPGTAAFESLVATTEDGKTVNLLDSLFLYGEFFIICMGSLIINYMEPKLMEFDEKNRIRSYLFSMPVSRKEYVASKYIFTGAAMYIIMSLYMIWHTVSAAFMAEGIFANLSQMIVGFAIPFICLFLFMAAVEMPLYFMLGKEKAMMVRVAFWMVIGFFVIRFLLFGDLTLIENWDIEVLMSWVDAHASEMTVFITLSPVISLLLYYLSYRITAGLYERRETL